MVAKHQVVAYTQKSQIKHENRHIQLVREYGFHPRTKATVEDGDVLPKKFEPFPENMYGKPLEEIDTFIYEERLSTETILNTKTQRPGNISIKMSPLARQDKP
uniref:Uncharacterized protein n=1 Tax=Glossina pallidipes TaxID=7398 RepID=A0A1B0A970_GLOPL